MNDGNGSTRKLLPLLLGALLLAGAPPAVSGDATTPQDRGLRTLWRHSTPDGLPLSLQVDRKGRPYVYAALQDGGLLVLDTSSNEPVEAARILPARLAGLAPTYVVQRGRILYVAIGDFFAGRGSKAGLATIDVKDPADPRVLALWTSARKLKGAASVLVKGRYAYLGAMTRGVLILDVSRADRIELLSSIQPDVDFPRPNPNRRQHPNARGLAVRGSLLYVAYDAGGIRVVDVADRGNPREVGRYINPRMGGKQQAYNNLLLDWPLAYVAVDYCGLEILDLRDPDDIRQVGWWNPWRCDSFANLWFNSGGHTNQLAFDARRELVYVSAGDSELEVVDVSDPASPRRVAGFGETGNGRGVWGLTRRAPSIHLAYIETPIPFRGTWSGIEALRTSSVVRHEP